MPNEPGLPGSEGLCPCNLCVPMSGPRHFSTAAQKNCAAFWAAFCLSLEMEDATAELHRTQRLRVKSGTSKALPYCGSLLSQSAHQAALMLQLCLEGTCGRTPAADHQPSRAAPALSPALAWLSLGGIQQPARGSGELQLCSQVATSPLAFFIFRKHLSLCTHSKA